MSSIIGIIGIADLGIGFGLVNGISEAYGNDDVKLAQSYISNAFFTLFIFSGILILLFVFVNPLINWSIVFNISTSLALIEVETSVALFFILCLLGIPINLIHRIQMGLQKTYLTNLWLTLGNIFSIIGVIYCYFYQKGLPILVFVLVGFPLIASILNIIIFTIFNKKLIPNLKLLNFKLSKKIIKLGFLFFVLQLVSSIAYQSDSIVVAQILGADQVPQYAVPYKLFSLVPMIMNFILLPLWPAYGEAKSRGDHLWVLNTFKKSVRISLIICIPISFFLFLFGRKIIILWAGENINPSILLIFLLSIWMLLKTIIGGPISMFFNGLSIVKFQVITNSIMAVINLLLSIYFVHQIGVSGVILGSIISTILILYIPSIMYIKPLLLKTSKDICL